MRKTYPISGIILFLLSLLYLGAELLFNVRLLDTSSSVRVDPQQAENVQYFGRMVSGLGFTLLILSLFQPSGFRITSRRQWLLFSAVAFVCLLPFLMTFGQLLFGLSGGMTYTPEIIWGFIPFIGLFLVLSSRGMGKFRVVTGLIVLAWAAMFYGQKLAIERFVIAPTTAEERLNANYILMIKTGIEDCVIPLGDMWLCDGKDASVEKRATRAVLGALFMLNPAALFEGMKPEQSRVIENMAVHGLWFSPKEYYQRYIRQVLEERDKYEHALYEEYYLPYRKASDLYLEMKDSASGMKIPEVPSYKNPEKFSFQSSDATVEKLALQVGEGIDQAWKQYQDAVSAYQGAAYGLALTVAQESSRMQGIYDACREKDCLRKVPKVPVDGGKLAGKAEKAAARKFQKETGYPPDIEDRDQFLKHPKTQEKLNAEIEKKIQDQMGDVHFKLPEGWKYDPVSFKGYVRTLVEKTAEKKMQAVQAEMRMMQEKMEKMRQGAVTARQNAQEKIEKNWKNGVQSQFNADIPPGLSQEEFFKFLGMEPLPPLEKLIMSEGEFMQEYIIPMNRKIFTDSLKKIREEASFYVNGGRLAEEGKSYIRALYVPAIALVVSLMIVVLTVVGNAVNAACLCFSERVRLLSWAGFLLTALLLPYLGSNPYTFDAAYQKYYHSAKERAAPAAFLLDWVVHMQPLIYRAGRHLPSLATTAVP